MMESIIKKSLNNIDLVLSTALAKKVPIGLVLGVITQESAWDPKAISAAGAVGLMQLMPKYFGKKELLLDPRINVNKGINYLKQLLNEFKEFPLVLAAYNAGPSYVRKKLREGSAKYYPETMNYINNVLVFKNQWENLFLLNKAFLPTNKSRKSIASQGWGNMWKYNAPRDGGKRYHKGIDIYYSQKSFESEKIYAISKGVITNIYPFYYDTYAIEQKINPYVKVVYGEVAKSTIKVKVGDKVDQNTYLADMGELPLNVPRMLHFEVHLMDKKINAEAILFGFKERIRLPKDYVIKRFTHNGKDKIIINGTILDVEASSLIWQINVK